MADPRRSGSGCPIGSDPTNAAALAESIRSDPGLEATTPVELDAEGARGLMLDVRLAAGATGGCGGLAGRTDGGGLRVGDRARFYLFDAPAGASMRVLAIVIVVPESRFEAAVEAADPISGVTFVTP
jgi:hypothetical protein